MAIKAWVGGTDANFDTAANWQPSGVPADADTLIFNDASTRALTGNIDAGTLAAKDFAVLVAPGFQYYIGTAALPMEPAQGFSTIVYSGSGLTPSYFSADGAQTITRGIIDTSVSKDDIVVFQGAGSIDQVIVRQGKAKLNCTATSGGRIEVTGSQPGAPAELNIPASITLTGVDIGVRAGKLSCSSDCVNVNVSGGEFILAGAADMTNLLLLGGTFHWDATDVSAPSTITEAEIVGGTFRIREDRAGRTLTNMNIYAGGSVDFSTGGLNVTYTNAPRNLGGNFKLPVGASITVGV